MKALKISIIFCLFTLVLFPSIADAGYVYESQWETNGTGNGQFNSPPWYSY